MTAVISAVLLGVSGWRLYFNLYQSEPDYPHRWAAGVYSLLFLVNVGVFSLLAEYITGWAYPLVVFQLSLNGAAFMWERRQPLG